MPHNDPFIVLLSGFKWHANMCISLYMNAMWHLLMNHIALHLLGLTFQYFEAVLLSSASYNGHIATIISDGCLSVHICPNPCQNTLTVWFCIWFTIAIIVVTLI